MLRFRYGKKAQTIRSATLLYYTFLKGYQEAKSEIPQQETLSKKVTFPVQSIPVTDVAVVEPASEPQNAVFTEASEGDVSESVEAKADEVSEELYEDWIVHELRIRKIPYVDNRSLNGCLWIESDMSTPLPLNEAAKKRISLSSEAGWMPSIPESSSDLDKGLPEAFCRRNNCYACRNVPAKTMLRRNGGK